MKAISFLGLGNYTETEYTYGSLRLVTQFFPIFILYAFKPKIFNVFITNEVKEKRWETFLTCLTEEDKKKVRAVEIPSGKNQAELWEIFQKIVAVVDFEENIIIDVTHAFRSIPMLALMAAQYMKTTKKVILEGIYYGAYEARTDNQTPVFDLSPLVELMEWTAALVLFNQTGSALGLSRILTEQQRKYYKQKRGTGCPRKLKTFGKWLDGICADLLQLKTRTAMKKIWKFPRAVDEAKEEIINYVPPLAAVLESTINLITSLGYENPDELSVPLISKELDLAMWYSSHNNFLQAVGLLRETLINLACLKLNVAEPFNYKTDRKKVENFLGLLSTSPNEWLSHCMMKNEALWWQQLAALYSKTRERRNVLMHAEVAHEQISINNNEINEWIKKVRALLEKT